MSCRIILREKSCDKVAIFTVKVKNWHQVSNCNTNWQLLLRKVFVDKSSSFVEGKLAICAKLSNNLATFVVKGEKCEPEELWNSDKFNSIIRDVGIFSREYMTNQITEQRLTLLNWKATIVKQGCEKVAKLAEKFEKLSTSTAV